VTTFLLIRHGETDAVGKSLMGWAPGWRLNPEGRRQVDRLAQRLARLPLRALYTSPLERARETAAAIAAPHGLTGEPLDELGEVHLGEWQGRTFTELDPQELWRRYNAFRAGVPAPGGELMIETQVRVVRTLIRLAARHPDQLIAIVSHGDPLRCILAHFLGIPLDLLARFEVSPASVSVLEFGPWSSRVLCLNHTGEAPL
jgi:broad specificity phosphatase PhoE